MTVRAADVALRDLGPDLADRTTVAYHRADRRTLHTANVIEVEHTRVGFSAVDARMLRKVSRDFASAIRSRGGGPTHDALMMALAPETHHVFGAIYGVTRFAHAVACARDLVPEAEILADFRYSTPPATLHAPSIARACASVMAFAPGAFTAMRESLGMPDAHSLLSAWSNYYVITGSSAAALTGLMFVVITLSADYRPARNIISSEGVSTFNTPTVVHFCVALFASAVLSAPWRLLAHAALPLGAVALVSLAYTARVARGTHRIQGYRADLEDWTFNVVLPFAAYVAMLVSAIRLAAAPDRALFGLATAVLLLIFIGIHNAWDVVTFMTVRLHERRRRDAGTEDRPPQSSDEAER